MNITELLSSPLIQKYFGCDPKAPHKGGPCPDFDCHTVTAYKILTAMCEPIKINESYVALSSNSIIGVMSGARDEIFHPHNLRLPDQWQPKAVADVRHCCEKDVVFSSCKCNCHKSPSTDEVINDKIQRIIYDWSFKEVPKEEKLANLQALVKLAREGK